MLKRFQIEDFALIARADLRLAPGLNVISGESGAGKSMLLDALTVLFGGRSDGKQIRQGAPEALLRAEFSDAAPLYRRLRPRRSQSFLGEQRLNQRDLQQFGRERLSLYGQHQNHALLRPEEQRQRLDRYGKISLHKLRQAWQNWKQAEQQWAQREAERAQWQAQQALWQYQWQEFEQISPRPGEFQQLSARQERLSAAETLLQQGEALQALLEQLSEQGKSAWKQSQSAFPELAELCEQAWIHHQEALSSLNKALFSVENDPAALQEIEARMAVLHQLARKHRCEPEHLHEYGQALQKKMEGAAAEDDAALQEALQRTERAYLREAQAVREQRQATAPLLAGELIALLAQLGMERAQLQIELRPAAASALGIDGLQFWVSFNAGQALQPLQNVASGGELSRFSLALELATLGEQPVPTIIFDEVDSGIGGQVAHTIGRLLKRLASRQQVICITHLAQVACHADRHFAMEKKQGAAETISRIHVLDDGQRVRELARMLGNPRAESSLHWAETLWREAQQLR